MQKNLRISKIRSSLLKLEKDKKNCLQKTLGTLRYLNTFFSKQKKCVMLKTKL